MELKIKRDAALLSKMKKKLESKGATQINMGVDPSLIINSF